MHVEDEGGVVGALVVDEPRLFIMLCKCGHQGQTDRPDIFNQVFHEFFSSGRVSKATADAAGVSKHRPELPDRAGQA